MWGSQGGADSLTLMWMLNERLKRVPINYELFAAYIDPGYEGSFGESLEWYGKKIGFPIRVEYTDYGPLAHSPVNTEKIPAFYALVCEENACLK